MDKRNVGKGRAKKKKKPCEDTTTGIDQLGDKTPDSLRRKRIQKNRLPPTPIKVEKAYARKLLVGHESVCVCSTHKY